MFHFFYFVDFYKKLYYNIYIKEKDEMNNVRI